MKNATSTPDQILSCTQNLIISGGYNNFSYADIAKVVGIRKPSIHHHFPSKAALVRALVSRYREHAEAGFAALEQQKSDPYTVLQTYTGYWKTCIADGSSPFCMCALLAGELPALPEDVAREVRAFFRSLSAWLTSVFERGAQQNRLHLTNPPLIEAEIFMATVHGAMLSARAYEDPTIFDAIMNPVMDRLSAG